MFFISVQYLLSNCFVAVVAAGKFWYLFYMYSRWSKLVVTLQVVCST